MKGRRGRGIDEIVELTAEQARKAAEVDGEIDRLDRLLSEVIRDLIEAAEEGWPDADLKYDDLESQIRAAIKTAEALPEGSIVPNPVRAEALHIS